MRKLFIAMLLVALSVTGVNAADAPVAGAVFIAIADVETGRALVPEGTIVPAGVQFYVHRIDVTDVEVESREEDGNPAAGQALVFAYAPEAQFMRARRDIAAQRATVERDAPAQFESPDAQPRRKSARDFVAATQNTPTWIYLYFEDGSYLAAMRHRWVDSNGRVSWGVSTKVFSEAGGYYKGTLMPRQTSNLVWGPTGGPNFDPYAYSKTCYTDYLGGSCQTMLPYVETQTAIIDSKGTILQRFGPCIQYPNQPPPDQPCMMNYAGTIRTTVPW